MKAEALTMSQTPGRFIAESSLGDKGSASSALHDCP